MSRIHSAYSSTIAQETVRVPFRRWFSFINTTSYSNLFNLVPNNLGDVVAAMRTSFAHWRLNSLDVKMFAGSLPVGLYTTGRDPGGDLALGLGFTCIDYTKFASTPSWNSATQMPQFEMSNALGVRLKVGRAELRKTTVPWLETTSTGSESEAFQSAGTLWNGSYVNTAVTGGYVVHGCICGEVEFRDRIDNTVSLFAAESDGSKPLNSKARGPVAETDEREYFSIPRGIRQEEDVLSVSSRVACPPPSSAGRRL